MGIVKLGGWGAGRFANRPYGGMDSGSGAEITGGEGGYEAGTRPAHRRERVALARV